jgi:transposase InsO family protein
VLYVLVVIAHGRRDPVHVHVTAHPAAAGVWRQFVEATGWGRRPRFLLRDRDAVDGGDSGKRAEALGIEPLLAPVRAPRANAVAERVIGTIRRESLDYLIVLSERHMRAVLAEITRSDNRDRPHRTLQLQTCAARELRPCRREAPWATITPCWHGGRSSSASCSPRSRAAERW